MSSFANNRCPQCGGFTHRRFKLCTQCSDQATVVGTLRERLGEDRYRRFVAYAQPVALLQVLKLRQSWGEAYRAALCRDIGRAWAEARARIKAINPGGKPL